MEFQLRPLVLNDYFAVMPQANFPYVKMERII
jgi:hypothetical protein